MDCLCIWQVINIADYDVWEVTHCKSNGHVIGLGHIIAFNSQIKNLVC